MKQAPPSSAAPDSLSAARPAAAEPQRQRATRLDVQISQQAMQVVLPTNQEIGPWQRRAVWLLALAERLGATGRHDPGLAEEAETLLVAVEGRRRQLLRAVQGLPADVARSTRLEDTERALESVAGVLHKTLDLMRPARRRRR